MNTKKIFTFSAFSIFFISTMSWVLGATTIDPQQAGEIAGTGLHNLGQGIGAFFGAFFGDTIIGTLSITKIFMTILIGMVVYSSIESFFGKEKGWIRWTTTIIITLLAIMGIPNGMIEGIRAQYGAMGATILTIIPIIIIFWFSIRTPSLFFARLTWVVYAIYYAIAVVSEFFKLGMPTGLSIIILIFAITMFIFIGAIRGKIFLETLDGEIEKGMEKVKKRKTATDINDANLSAQTGVKI